MPPKKPKSSVSAVRTVTPIIPLAIALLPSALVPSPSGVRGAPNTSEVVPVTCGEGLEDYLACHSEYPTGCNSNGTYDAYLNEFKNQVKWADPRVQKGFTSLK